MIELERINYNKETKEESIGPLFLDENEVTCIYKDSRGVYLVTKRGFMYKVPYTQKRMQEFFKAIWDKNA